MALNKRYGNWWSSIGGAGLEIQYQNPVIGSASMVVPARRSISVTPTAASAPSTAGSAMSSVRVPAFSSRPPATPATGGSAISIPPAIDRRRDAVEQGPGARLKGEIWGGYMNQVQRRHHGHRFELDLRLGSCRGRHRQVTAVFEGRREAKEAALGLATLPDGSLGASATTCSPRTGRLRERHRIGNRRTARFPPAQNVVVGVGATYLKTTIRASWRSAASIGASARSPRSDFSPRRT